MPRDATSSRERALALAIERNTASRRAARLQSYKGMDHAEETAGKDGRDRTPQAGPPQRGSAVREIRKDEGQAHEESAGHGNLHRTDGSCDHRGRDFLSCLPGGGGGRSAPRGVCRARRGEGAYRRTRSERSRERVLRCEGEGAF